MRARLLRIPLPMHRMLLVFLLVFLPLQSIWAAASPYCGHESAPQASQHFGHHVHDHQADLHGDDADAAPAAAYAGDTSDHKALTSSGTVDMDCHACHGAGSGMVWSAGAQALVVAVALPRGPDSSRLGASPSFSPRTPQLAPLA